MVRFILGFIIGVALLVGCAYAYFTTGMAPAAATAQPMPFERYFANAALRAKLQREAPKTVPVEATPENLLEGAKVYKQDCAFCHGSPNSKPSDAGRGMFPSAPQFFAPRPNFARFRGRRPESGPGRSARGRAAGRRGERGGRGGRGGGRDAGIAGDFWRVKNGIRLTGMPSFEKDLSEQQMWDVVVMLSRRRNLPPTVTAALAPAAAAPAASPQPAKSVKPAAKPKRD